MRSTIVVSALLCGAAVLGSQARAQAPPAANPAPVPEVMPFVIPYGTPIGIDRAKQVAAAAVAEAKRHPNWKEAVAVVGPAGELIYFEKMDDAQIAAIAIAQHKARVAATFRRSTQVFEEAINGGSPSTLTLDGVVASRGGLPLVEAGKLIGAVGCSGGIASQDLMVCQAGAALIK
jgi:glc operon protein GlcG